jgi:hypothetical protein
MNFSQRPCEEESFRKMVHTQVDCLAWDYQLSPNPHALTIYLKFVPTHGTAPKRFKKCKCEDDNVRLHYQTWIPSDGHYRWL